MKKNGEMTESAVFYKEIISHFLIDLTKIYVVYSTELQLSRG